MSDPEKNTNGKFEEKVETIAKSFERGLDNAVDKFEEKINSIDVEYIEQFLVKLGKCIVLFFTITIPTLARRIKRIFQSDTWKILAPILLLIMISVICVVIGSNL